MHRSSSWHPALAASVCPVLLKRGSRRAASGELCSLLTTIRTIADEIMSKIPIRAPDVNSYPRLADEQITNHVISIFFLSYKTDPPDTLFFFFFFSERDVPRTCQKLGRLGLIKYLSTSEANRMCALCRFQKEKDSPERAGRPWPSGTRPVGAHDGASAKYGVPLAAWLLYCTKHTNILSKRSAMNSPGQTVETVSLIAYRTVRALLRSTG